MIIKTEYPTKLKSLFVIFAETQRKNILPLYNPAIYGGG